MQIQLAHEKEWFYRLVAKNGKTIMVSETYLTKWNAKRAAKKVARRNGFDYREV